MRWKRRIGPAISFLPFGGPVLAAALVLAWLLLLRPPFLGGSVSYIVVAGTSMEPSLHGGDLAVLRKQDRYGRGDVIAFHAEGGVVIHRIAGGTASEGYVTKGDNKSHTDAWLPKPENILGKMWFRIPEAGNAIAFWQNPLVLGVSVAAIVALPVLTGSRVNTARRRHSGV